MKKLLACTLILSLVLILAIPIPASACDGGAIQNWECKWWDWYKGWWEHIPGLQPTEPEPTEPEPTEPEAPAPGVPTVTTAKYVHKTPYYGMKAHLEISWEAVEGAESYEVLITKADGETITYTTDSTSLYDTAAKCPGYMSRRQAPGRLLPYRSGQSPVTFTANGAKLRKSAATRYTREGDKPDR